MRHLAERLFTIGKAEDDVWAGAGDDMIALHGPDGRFVRVSAGAMRTLGRAPEDLRGGRLMDLVVPADQRRLLAALSRLGTPEAEGFVRFEVRLCGQDGEAVPVEMSLTRTRRGFRSVTRHITHRLARERTIKTEARSLTDQAMRRTDQLTNISHEIKTPLNAVIGFAEAIHQERFGPIGNDRYRDYARIIHESGEHLLELISDILDLSKAEANETMVNAGPEEPERLVQLCADIMQLRVAEAGLGLRVEIEEGIGQVMLDARIVRQILLNLLSNALKFTASGHIAIGARISGDHLLLSVTDTGIGMSPDDLALVGQRFRQARHEGVRGGRGTGIGLSLSKALARVHGGELRLVSGVGEGTEAILRLPLERPEAKGTEGNVVDLTEVKRLHAAERANGTHQR